MLRALGTTVALAAVLAAGACRDEVVKCADLPVAEVTDSRDQGGLVAEARSMFEAQRSDNSAEVFGSARLFGSVVERMARLAEHPSCAPDLPEGWAAAELAGLAKEVVSSVSSERRAAYVQASPVVRRWAQDAPDTVSADQFRRASLELFDEYYWTRLDPDYTGLRTIDAGQIKPLTNVEEFRRHNVALSGIHTQVRKGAELAR